MPFTSSVFWVLLLLTFGFYYTPLFKKIQIELLILSSLIFYSYSQPALLLLLLFSVMINIFSSYYVAYGSRQRRKTYATLGVVLNLAILLFFKYSPLFAKTFLSSSNSVGEFLLTLPLPIGISFFTFQGISLVVDVYTEKYSSNRMLVPENLFLHARQVLFFKGFFPQLISGPIVKAHFFIPQIGHKAFGNIDWIFVIKRLILGYFLKMVVADNLKDFTFWISYPYFMEFSSLTLLIMLFGYSCQIFADFAGYSLMAIGFAKLFGYDFPINFNFPYISTSFKEFWKRWHISLSSFLMEYLYFPLGGNRKGRLRTYFNLMIVMLLGGLWHGAAWSYAIWGGFHGLALAAERFFGEYIKVKKTTIVRFFTGILVFCFVTLAWLLFKLPDFGDVVNYFKCLFHNFNKQDDYEKITYLLLYSSPVFFYHILYLLRNGQRLLYFPKVEFAFYGFLLFLIIVNSGSSGSFIYFQF
jgi:alginate O-acetyltransferase complex protein AlgI